MEDSDIQGESVSSLTNLCNEFAKYVKDKGYSCGIYANLNWFRNKLDIDKFDKIYLYGLHNMRLINQV